MPTKYKAFLVPARQAKPSLRVLSMTPKDIEFNKAIAALATRRDRHISATRLLGGGVQFLGFEQLAWNKLQPVLAQFNKCGYLSKYGTQLALRLEDETRVNDTEPIADMTMVGPTQNLVADPEATVCTPSVNRLRYGFIDASAGVSTRCLAGIAALPNVFNIKMDRCGVSVLSATKNDFATGLYNTIRQWKKAPHLQQLSSRPLSRSMKPRRVPKRVKRGLRRSRF